MVFQFSSSVDSELEFFASNPTLIHPQLKGFSWDITASKVIFFNRLISVGIFLLIDSFKNIILEFQWQIWEGRVSNCRGVWLCVWVGPCKIKKVSIELWNQRTPTHLQAVGPTHGEVLEAFQLKTATGNPLCGDAMPKGDSTTTVETPQH